MKIFFQKVINSKDPLLINETCFFISNLLGDKKAIEKYAYNPVFLKEENYLKKKFNSLYTSVSLFFKKGISGLGNTNVDDEIGMVVVDDYYTDYEKFKLRLKSVFNIWDLFEEMQRIKKVLKEIMKKEKKLKSEIDEFKKLADDDDFKMMMGVGNNQILENNTFQENLQCLAAYREIFNQAAF